MGEMGIVIGFILIMSGMISFFIGIHLTQVMLYSLDHLIYTGSFAILLTLLGVIALVNDYS